MGELTSEWCLERAERHLRTADMYSGFEPEPSLSDIEASQRKVATAMTIAARVLEEGAVERLAQFIPGENAYTQDFAGTHDIARAVLAHLKGEG